MTVRYAIYRDGQRVATELVAALEAWSDSGLDAVSAAGDLDGDGNVQLELPFDNPYDDKLDTALDAVRDRFGGKAVTRAASIGHDLNPSVPILSD